MTEKHTLTSSRCLRSLSSSENAPADQTFSICQMNILADYYGKMHSMGWPFSRFCLKEHLAWDYRWPLIKTVVLSRMSEVVCLEELDGAHWSLALADFRAAGFDGRYLQKMCDKPDGSAIFIKTTVFKVLEQKNMVLDTCCGLKSAQYDQVALALLLQHIPSGRMLRVAATHLKSEYGGSYEAVRLAQVVSLATQLGDFHPLVPIVLCGDFNSHPTQTVKAYLSSAVVRAAAGEVQIAKEQDLTNPLPLESVYGLLPGGEPPFTCYVDDYKGTIDYIMFSRSLGLQPLEVLDIPKLETMPFIPHETHPSDHLELFARFVFNSV